MPKIRNLVFVTIFASQFRFIEKTRFLTATRTNQKPGFCHNICFPVWIYRKNPVSHSNAQKPGFSHLCAGGASLWDCRFDWQIADGDAPYYLENIQFFLLALDRE